MNVFHVEVVCCDGIRDGVLGQDGRLFDRITAETLLDHTTSKKLNLRRHQLRIQFYRIIAQFGCCDGLQTLTTLWQIRISLHPTVAFVSHCSICPLFTGLPETIHVGATPTFKLVFLVPLEPSFCVHIDAVYLCSGFDKGKIETVSVISSHDRWLGVSDVLEPFAYHRGLARDELDLSGSSHLLTSSGSLKTVNSPSYSSFGVYSKSSMSSLTISLLVIKNPCPSIMYEIIII